MGMWGVFFFGEADEALLGKIDKEALRPFYMEMIKKATEKHD
ncbi:hypothetical protein [Mammaliicoccus vitulinus]|nr:hypothetical protein [Mammaliicoccus vitulinus]